MLRDIKFRDSQVRNCYERNFAEVADRSPEMSQVGALIAAHDMFDLLEGPHSPRVHETIEHLLTPGLRPVVRSWYRQLGANLKPEEDAFKAHLGVLAGESF